MFPFKLTPENNIQKEIEKKIFFYTIFSCTVEQQEAFVINNYFFFLPLFVHNV